MISFWSYSEVILALCLAFMAGPPEAAAFTDAEIKSAGFDALESFRSSVAEFPSEYGFKDKDEVAQFTLGTAIPLCLVDYDKLEHYQPGDPLEKVLYPPGAWYFPVMLAGEAKAIVSIVVLKDRNVLAPEAFGKANLARNLAPFLSKYKGGGLVVVSGRNPLEIFISVNSEARPNLSPLSGDLQTALQFVKRPADAGPVLSAMRASSK